MTFQVSCKTHAIMAMRGWLNKWIIALLISMVCQPAAFPFADPQSPGQQHPSRVKSRLRASATPSSAVSPRRTREPTCDLGQLGMAILLVWKSSTYNSTLLSQINASAREFQFRQADAGQLILARHRHDRHPFRAVVRSMTLILGSQSLASMDLNRKERMTQQSNFDRGGP